MPVSQFTIYSSADRNAPILIGETGSLISVLDACLVYGYGDKSPAGWTKPVPNEYGIGLTGSLGCWRQGSGSMLTMVVNDSPPTMSAGAYYPQEAWFHGWENIYGLTASVVNCIGSGSGMFPTVDVIYFSATVNPKSSSCFVIRKSATADKTQRQWIMFADAHTMYFFVKTGDDATKYSMYVFGDIYSLKPTPDLYKCIITGRVSTIQGSIGAQHDGGDTLQFPHFVSTISAGSPVMARSVGGGGGAMGVNKIGDAGRLGRFTTSSPAGGTITGVSYMYGTVPFPNPYDNSIYLTPISICESPSGVLRGRMRGLWMLSHTVGSISDGQVIYGSNEHYGKKFQVVKFAPNNGAFIMEISNTVETNPPNS